MSDELKKIYNNADLSDHFWDISTPMDIWRAQKKSEFDQGRMPLEPHPGSETRLPDVKVVERDNQTIVLGCRCIKGEFRGISTFDRKVTWFGSKTTKHFVIPANTPIPAGIAITKDHKNQQGAYHYTIAPKDDMPLSLFLQNLKALCQQARLEV